MITLTPEATTGLLLGGAAMITALTAVVALLVTIRRDQRKIKDGQDEIHVLVNSQLQAVVTALAAQDVRVAQLEARFVELGIDLPPDPGGGVEPPPPA